MKKFLLSIILIFCLPCMAGCGTDLPCRAGCGTEVNNGETKTKHVVNLTIDNYQDYLTIETTLYIRDYMTSYYNYFRGALSYAYYDNVIITYDYISSGSSTTTTEETIKLNLGGCGCIVTSSSSRYGGNSYEITNVSGTITYWI